LRFLQGGLERAARVLRDAGLTVPGYCRAGMVVADGARRDAARDDNRRAVDEAVALQAQSLVVVAGGLPQFSQPGSGVSKDLAAARSMVAEELALLFDYAKSAAMPLALEPLHPMHAGERGCISTMRQALDLCDTIDPERDGALGLAIDVYHVWWDPDLREQIERAGRKRILAFHVCDWLAPTNHMLNDRGMMGDGIIDIPRIRSWIEAVGYTGFVEVEIFSEHWWRQPMEIVLQTCIDRFRDFV
jgi:sugar phosphate isomerase/epimerase